MRWILPPQMRDSVNGLVRETRRSMGKNANNHHGEVSSLCWRERYLHNYLVQKTSLKNDRVSRWDVKRDEKRDFGKEWDLVMRVSLRATLSKIEQKPRRQKLRVTSDTVTNIPSHESWAQRTTVLKRPKKYLSALTWDTNDKGLQRTRDATTTSELKSSTHTSGPWCINTSKKKGSTPKKLFGGSQNKTPRPFV